MNGRFPRAYFSFGGGAAAMYPGADWKRLYAALVVSCLLHASLILMPSFGASTTVSRPAAARGAQKPGPARVLDVRLGQASESSATARRPAAGASAADPPARPMASKEPRPALNRARGIDLLPIPAPTYYTTDQLTKPPQPTSQPKLDVPRAIARAVSGEVKLKVWIDELGNVDSVEVESSNLPEAVAGRAAAAFRKLHFVPGEIDGRRVRALMRIEVAYGKRPPP